MCHVLDPNLIKNLKNESVFSSNRICPKWELYLFNFPTLSKQTNKVKTLKFKFQPRPTGINIYRLNYETILKIYVTKARTLSYPPYICTCHFNEGLLSRLCFLMFKFSKDELVIIEFGFSSDCKLRWLIWPQCWLRQQTSNFTIFKLTQPDF